MQGGKPQLSLCEECKKATGGCSWADSFIDVPGWTADVTIIASVHTVSGESFDSRLVYDCPEFVPDDRSWLEHVNSEGFQEMAANCIKLAVKDWLKHEEIREDIEDFLFSKYFTMLSDLDPKGLLRMMRRELEERNAGKTDAGKKRRKDTRKRSKKYWRKSV